LDQLARDERNTRDPDRLRHWVGEFWEHEQVACAVFGPNGGRGERTEELPAEAVPDAPPAAGAALADRPALGRQRALPAPPPAPPPAEFPALLASFVEACDRLGRLTAQLLALAR